MLPYSLFLALSGIVLSVAERIWPRDPRQQLLRRGWAIDLFYLFLNAEIVGSLVAIWIGSRVPYAAIVPWREALHLGWIAGEPVWVQLVVLLGVKDFLQWCIHNAMHRVPVLWNFHRTHHSTVQMDWLSNWRFHWVEIVVYQLVLYVPATLLGFSAEAAYGCAIVSTAVGEFAHANLRVSLGPLKYVLNCPELHTWHHVHPDYGPENRNFAITFSCWDWMFGTAYVAERGPEKLGVREVSVPL